MLRRSTAINRKKILSTGVLSVAAAGFLTGCLPMPGGDDDSEAAPGASAPPPAPTASAPASQPPAAGNAQVTPPGTKLKVGQQAVVPYKYGTTKTGTIGITVTSIAPADAAAFRQSFGAKAEGLSPYAIRYTVTNIGGTDLSYAGGPRLSAVGSDGRLTGVVLIGSLPDCKSGTADRNFTAPGTTFEGCRLQAARTGNTVTGAQFSEQNGGYDDAPIVWTR
jgi:hypothetical protein